MRSNLRRTLSSEIRSILVERFEEVVSKEITNHNLAIKKYRDDLKSLSDDFKSILRNQETIKQDTEKAYLLSQTNCISEMRRLESDFETQRRYIKESRSIIMRAIIEFDDRLKNSTEKDFFDESIEKQIVRFEALEQKIEMSKKCHAEDLYSCTVDLRHYINDAEYKNLDKISELAKSVSELSEQLAISKVDFDGVMKEISSVKNRVFITEKNIENLYTLIDRLTKEGP